MIIDFYLDFNAKPKRLTRQNSKTECGISRQNVRPRAASHTTPPHTRRPMAAL